jgi:uroporphyrinogen-III synthase
VRLLVTRPEPDGARTAQALRARGHAVVLAPLLRMETIAFVLPDQAFSAVVLTSANAARAIADHPGRAQLTALTAFTVGRRTAEAARALGFRDVRSADGDKGDLVDLLRADLVRADLLRTDPLRIQSGDRAPLLYLAGEDRAGDLAAAGLPVHTAVVYRAVKADHFPPPVAAALAQREIDGVLHFSARSAEAYLDCAAHDAIRESALAPVHYCLSRQVAAPLSAAGAAAVRIAARPDEMAMLELVGSG